MSFFVETRRCRILVRALFSLDDSLVRPRSRRRKLSQRPRPWLVGFWIRVARPCQVRPSLQPISRDRRAGKRCQMTAASIGFRSWKLAVIALT